MEDETFSYGSLFIFYLLIASDVKKIHERYRLEFELDENEKAIAQLQKEDLELKMKKPNLKLRFNDG